MNRIDGPHAPTDQRLHREHTGSSYSKWVRGIGFVLAVAFLGVLLYFMRGLDYRLHPKVYEEAPLPTYRAADLHELGGTVTEIGPVDPSGLGNLAAFDPLAHVAWFENLARTWSPDARLVALELHGVRALGTLDVATPGSDPYVRYGFASKARGALAKQMAKANATLSWSAIDIVVKRNLIQATVVTNTAEDRDPSPVLFGCGVPQLVDMWRSRGLSPQPTYDLELDDARGPKQELVWQSLGDRVPRIGADCRFR